MVADPHHVGKDPDLAFYFDADWDLDPAFHVDKALDSTLHFDADQGPPHC
jgi:hypothetical protein